MSRTPTGPDDVTAPAADSQLFRSSPTWYLLIYVPAMLLGVTAVSLLIDLLDGVDLSWRHLGVKAAALLPATAAGAGFFAWQIWRRRSWVRISSGGVELAADGGDPILLDWSEIISARIRRRGLWAVLDVVPADPDTVHSTDSHRDLPRMRDTADGTAFTVQVGVLQPGPTALRTALARHTTTSR